MRVMLLLLGTLAALLWVQAAGGAKPAAEPSSQPSPWPVAIKLPAEVVKLWTEADPAGRPKADTADLLVWTPPGVKKIRAVMMLANNTDLVKIGEHKAIREVAAKHEIGIVYLQQIGGKLIEWADPPAAAEAGFAGILDQVARQTGIAEFRHAPWITVGKSSRGRFAFRPAWQFPDRVVASISYHGEAPTWPMADWSKVSKETGSILHVNVEGLSEWDGTWYRHVRPHLLNYHRHTQWLAHQLVIYGVDHGYYPDYYLYPNFGKPLEKNRRFIRCVDVWDYLALFIDKAMALRVPKDAYATDAPIKLHNVKREDGYLIHPRAPEELLATKWFALRQDPNGDYKTIPWPEEKTPVLDTRQGNIDYDKLIVPASQVPAAEQANYLWVADREQARAWLKLHNLYNLADRVLPPETRK